MLKQHKSNYIVLILFVIIIGICAFYIYKLMQNDKPQMRIIIPTSYSVGGNLNIKCPDNVQCSVMIDGYGTLYKTSSQQPLPIASVAKIMTAYLILKNHPLRLGEDGPKIAINQEDVKIYKNDKNTQQSVLKIKDHEILTEKQLLEGLLLPSGNDCATILAKWDAGSVKAFVEQMNKTAKQLGMNHTHYADPAGVQLETQSIANDQLKLALKAIKIAELRYIVSKPQTNLPIAGTVYNVDYDLGKAGIIGVKTGSMPQSGGDFVFASSKQLGWKKVLILGVLLGEYGEKPLMDVLKTAITITSSIRNKIYLKKLISKNQTVGFLEFNLGNPIELEAAKSLYIVEYPGLKIHAKLEVLDTKLPINKGQAVGYIKVYNAHFNRKVPVFVNQTVKGATLTQYFKSIIRFVDKKWI